MKPQLPREKNRIKLFALKMKAELCRAAFAIGQSGGKCVGIRVILCNSIKKRSSENPGAPMLESQEFAIYDTVQSYYNSLTLVRVATRPRTTGLFEEGGTARSSFRECGRV